MSAKDKDQRKANRAARLAHRLLLAPRRYTTLTPMKEADALLKSKQNELALAASPATGAAEATATQ